jgi:hypothetical protein
MQIIENPLSFLRMLKGAPASILLALVFSGRVMTNHELQVWTGYADDNVTKGLDFLVGVGWVAERTRRGPWKIADGLQLPMMKDAAGDSDFFGIPSSSSSYSLNTESEIKEIQEEEQETNPINSESFRILRAGGVDEETADRLARLPQSTPDFVTRHLAWAEEQGRPVGTAIFRIKKGWSPPKKKKEEEADDDRHKYINGPLAYAVNRDDEDEDEGDEQETDRQD